MSERKDRIKAIQDRMAAQRECDRREREVSQREMAELKSRVTSLVQRVELGERKFQQIMSEISEMSADIWGGDMKARL